MHLTDEQKERYKRHLILDEIGEEGQKKLLDAKVLIIGAGGLGSPAAMYLAAAGVGTIGIADADVVDLSNLQRQILHTAEDIGKEKVQSAQETLKRLRSDLVVRTYAQMVAPENIINLISPYDMILDATDNFTSKFLINDACVLAQKPFVHAGVTRFQGQIMTYVPDQGPCYRCIFQSPPPENAVPTGDQAGIVGAVCGVVGSLQAMEAVKYILGLDGLLTGYLLTCDLLHMEFRRVRLPKRSAGCTACGEHRVSLFEQ